MMEKMTAMITIMMVMVMMMMVMVMAIMTMMMMMMMMMMITAQRLEFLPSWVNNVDAKGGLLGDGLEGLPVN